MEPSATFFRVSTLRKRVPKRVPTCSGLTPTCRRLPKTCLNASVTSTGRVCVCVWVRALRKGREAWPNCGEPWLRRTSGYDAADFAATHLAVAPAALAESEGENGPLYKAGREGSICSLGFDDCIATM